MATHDDYDGVYFTIQAIRMYHPEVLDDVEFVIVDNNPSSDHAKCVRKFTDWIKEPFIYLPYTKYKSTTVKGKIFNVAETPYVLVIDSHVFLEPGSIKKLIEYFDSGKDQGNLLHGPLLYDDMKTVSTHFDLTWSSHMWGTWQTDKRGEDKDAQPFEIMSQGCGLFSCRKDAWLGFNPNFRGFGIEEGYIQEKFRQRGKKAMCLPFLRWMHRFDRPNPVTYPNTLNERFRNYMIGFHELGLDTTELREHFASIASPELIQEVEKEIEKEIELLYVS